MSTEVPAGSAGALPRGIRAGAGRVAAGAVVLLVPILAFPGEGSGASGPTGPPPVQFSVLDFWVGPALVGAGLVLVGSGLLAMSSSLGSTGDRWPPATLRVAGRMWLIPGAVLALLVLVPDPVASRAIGYVEALDDTHPVWSGIGQAVFSAAVLGCWLLLATVLVRSLRRPSWQGLGFATFGLLAGVTTLPLFVTLGAVWAGAGPVTARGRRGR